MISARTANRLVTLILLATLAAASSHGATVTLTGTVTEAGTGTPVAYINVGATRVSALGTGQPYDTIPVEAVATTNAQGVYTYSLSDATPGLDRVLVFTGGTAGINHLYNGVPIAGQIPTYAEVQTPGVVEVNLTQSVTGIDFALPAAGYTKTTYNVAMRDGIHLATDVYLPSGTGPWPVVLFRTTYDKNQDGVDQWPAWAARGYAVVSQDVRGTFHSEDIFRLFFDDGWGEKQDGYDTVQWILAQSWCNAKIGTVGGSARGITQNMLAGSLPPGVKCQHIGVAASDLYEHAFFSQGAFRKALAEDWSAGRGPASTQYLNTVVKTHPHSNDPFWDTARPENRYAQVTWPTVNVGGWYDIFLKGTINNFKRLQHNGQPGSDGRHKLIIGAYGHGTPESSFAWPGASSSGLRSQSELNWMDHWLKGVDRGVLNEPAVAYYMLGDVTQPDGPGNEWRYADDWPVPSTEVPFYLHAGGGLDTVPPAGAEASDNYQYDPANPVPTLGGANLSISKGPYDQASLESRPDVLEFTTPVLARPVEVTGQVTVLLYASSSAVDTDFTAKLCDVYPDGRSMIVCDGIVRARARNSEAVDEFMTPGTVYAFTIDLWETCIAFNAGHRIRVDISSSNYPRFDANPNTGEPFNQATHTVVATNSVFHDVSRPSRLLLSVTGPDEDANGVPDPADTDGDALPDTFEWTVVRHDPGDAIETLADVRGEDDYDGDGRTNAEEQAAGTDPTVADSPLPTGGPAWAVLLVVALAATAARRLRPGCARR